LEKKNRSDLIIATKARYPMGDGPNDLGLSSTLYITILYQ